MRWMNLEPIIRSEVSQKEKDKYHILTHIYTCKTNKKKGNEKIYIYIQGSRLTFPAKSKVAK